MKNILLILCLAFAGSGFSKIYVSLFYLEDGRMRSRVFVFPDNTTFETLIEQAKEQFGIFLDENIVIRHQRRQEITAQKTTLLKDMTEFTKPKAAGYWLEKSSPQWTSHDSSSH